MRTMTTSANHRSISRRINALIIIAICAITTILTTSCDDSYDYYDDYDPAITGTWSYQGDATGYFPYGSDNTFYFRPNGRGTYSCYANGGSGPWTTYPIVWSADGATLTIQVADWDIWQYDYDVTPGWLYLYPDYGGPYLVYSRN